MQKDILVYRGIWKGKCSVLELKNYWLVGKSIVNIVFLLAFATPQPGLLQLPLAAHNK